MIISIDRDNYIPYEKTQNMNIVVYPGFFKNINTKITKYLKNVHNVQRYYENIPETYLVLIQEGIESLTKLKFDSVAINGKPKFNTGDTASLILQDFTISVSNKKTSEKIPINITKGTLIIFKKEFYKEWSYFFPRHLTITFFNSNILMLSDIYLNYIHRNNLLQVIRDKLNHVKNKPIGKQCIKKLLNLTELLGSGDYGNVYFAELNNFNFAVKLSKLKPGAIDNPYSRYNSSWREVLIMKDILNPLIQNKICQNLPLLIDSFVCDSCELTIRDETKSQPCVITITELANGTLRDFLKNYKPSEEEIYSALFQIMAGLHAIQIHGQIMNYDVKADNILFYNVTSGGYWEYIIHGKKYFVPNFGKIFILNDFGISRPMSPNFQLYRENENLTFRLGSRFAMVKNKKFSPIISLKTVDFNGKINNSHLIKIGKIQFYGSQYSLLKNTQKVIDNDTQLSSSQKKFLKDNGLSFDPLSLEYFNNPEVIPPFEFYNDLQDAIRMFIGGKRTTQRGDHKRYPVVTDKIYKKLKKYNGKGENMNELIFSSDPSQILAGYFIEKFFKKDCNYKTKLCGKKYGTYNMS